MVEVEPLDVTARTMQFSGRLSLMILAPNEDGGRQSLARWDFAAEEVQSAVDTATEDHIIRFYLELPPDTPAPDSTEIWARLLPQGGNKLLAHAAINLREPGRFSSLSEPPVRRTRAEDRPAAAAVYEGTPSNPPAVHAQLNDAGWTIARPGEPAKLELAADDSEDQWRPSSEPMPTMIARRAPARRQPRVSRTAPRSQTSRTAAAKTRLPTGWSPDRPADAPASTARMAKTPGRPSWSATR
jgi:hypothetical protein